MDQLAVGRIGAQIEGVVPVAGLVQVEHPAQAHIAVGAVEVAVEHRVLEREHEDRLNDQGNENREQDGVSAVHVASVRFTGCSDGNIAGPAIATIYRLTN